MSRLLSPLLAALVILFSAPVTATAQTSASAVVEALHETLLSVMKEADDLGFEGRRERISPVFELSYNMPLIAKISTGRFWAAADEALQNRLIATMTRLSVATYATRFDGFSGESFRLLSEQPAPRNGVLVSSEIVKSDGDTVRLDYLMHETNTGWRIVDVYLHGRYSELAARRSEYTTILGAEGIDGLLDRLEQKIFEISDE